MPNPPSLRRQPWLPVLSCILLCAPVLQAAPTAVNDSFTATEDTPLTISSGGVLVSANWDAGADGFAYVDDAFGTASPNLANGTNLATDGESGTGGVHVLVGGRTNSQGTVPNSGAWTRTFNAPAAGNYGFTFRYRLTSGNGFENNEYQLAVFEVDSTRYGTALPASGQAPAVTALHRFIGDGNGGASPDSGWQTFSQTITLTAGSHTIRLGGFLNNSTTSDERSDSYFDNLVVTSAAGSLGVLANDTGTAPLTAVKDTNPANGTVVLNSDGTFTYTPAANFFGTDSFTYHASDSTGNSAPATVTLTVAAVNDVPVAAGDSYTVNEDTVLTVNAPGLLINDTDADGNSLTAALRSPPGKGTVTVNANGSITYTPNANANGTDSFTYRVNDGTVNSADATVTINVTPVNDFPVAVGDAYRTPVNTALNVSITDPAGQPTTSETLVASGSTVPAGDPAEADLPVWRYLDDGTNQGTAWRNAAFDDSTWLSGKAELGYGDSAEGRPERTEVGFGPDSNNKFPTTYFRTTFQAVDKGALTSLGLLLMRDDAAVVYLNGNEIYRDQSANGFPDLGANPAFDAFSNGSISSADEAALRDLTTFMTANSAQFLAEGTNTLAVEVHQANGPSSDLSMDLQLTAQRSPYAGVLYNDNDPDGSPLTAILVTGPAHGTLSLNANGTFLYTPAANYAGPDSFIYRVNDGSLNSTTATVNLTVVSAGNVPPVATGDSYATNEDTALNIAAPGVLSNDTDAENGTLTAQVLTSPSQGSLTLNADGSFLYTPVANYAGPDSFTYRARDPLNANSTAATVSLTVNQVNDAPVAAADTYGTDIGVTLNVSAAQGVLANDSDVEGTALIAQLVTGPASGTLTLNPNGSFTYTPPAGFSGSRTFTYRASDGTANSNTVTVTINMNGAPTAQPNNYTATEDTPLTVSAPGVLENDTDPENQALTAVVATQPAHGSVALSANGGFTYTPATNYSGGDSFTYQANDGVRLSAPATVSITVSAVNDAPIGQNDSYVTAPGQTLTIAAAQGVLANDSDAENSPLTLTQLSSTTNGVLTLSSDGSFVYVPNTGFSGPDTFTYRISDGTLTSSDVTVTITVKQPGDDIVINEIMYRPGGGFPENTAREWIELYNRGTTAMDLTGWTISSGVTFAFPSGRVMAPNSYLVVAADVASFQAANPGVTNVIGGWTGGLANGGEKIQLTDALGNNLDSVHYSNEGDWATRVRETTFNGWAWSTLADGGGRTIALRNAKVSNDNGQNWTVSSTVGGTPGAVNDVVSTNIQPIIKAVKHSPAVPTTSDRVTVSCELNDESPYSALHATLFWRNATTTSPPAFAGVAMSQDGKGSWFAQLDPQATNLTIIEFYISATDGVNTRTWPAATSEGQNANCQYQVSNETPSTTSEMYRLTLTAAENAAYAAVASSSDRQFNQTLIVQRGAETSIRYRCDMRIRGNSSRTYQFRPLRISIPADDDLDGATKFNLNPKNSHTQYFGMKLFQMAGLRGPDSIPAEVRRNGVEYTTSSGSTPDFGQWVRMEDLGGEMVSNHWKLPGADAGGIYKKGRNDYYWRNTQAAPGNPDSTWDGWTKQNGSAANDWTDVINFCSVWQAACQPYFPGSAANDVAGSGGSSTSGNGNWNNGVFTAAQISSVETVADLDQWARWFAVMTILQDNETNVSNGQDDDYGAYFEPRTVGNTVQRRLQFVPHDLDTIFGLGDSPLAFNAIGLYDMTEQSSVFRPLLPLFGNSTVQGNASFRTKYFNALRELLGTVFDADTTANPNPPFYQLVDYHLGNWAPANTRTAIKDFIRQRRTYLLGLMAQGATTPPAGTSVSTVTSARGNLFISEVFANNVSAHNNGGTFPDVIELQNTGGTAIPLAGMSLTDDPLVKNKYVFPAGTSLAAGTRLVLYADTAVAAPGTHLGFGLDSDGDAVYLYDTVAAGQAVVDSITFGLQPVDFSIGRTGAALDTWALCTPTVGAANTAVATLGAASGLRINEWLGNADYRAPEDFIEIYNGAAQPVAIGGMALTDDFINYPTRHVIPQLSFISAGGFVEFVAKGSDATPGNSRELPFNIGSSVGFVSLMGANGTMVDRGDTLPQFRDISTGRLPDGTGVFSPLAPPSPGLTNAALPDGELEVLNFLRITEMMYNPASTAQSEYIELRNTSDATASPVTLDISGVTFTNGITFAFPPGTTLAPGASTVIVENSARFSAQYPSVAVGGVYSGKLDNGGERIRLTIPNADIAILDFSYKDSWYPSTDGGGDALQIVNASASPAMWDRKEGWQASPPNPGTVPPFGIYAGADFVAPAGVPVLLDGALSPGAFNSSSVALSWTRESGPGTVTFTTATSEDANAIFPTPGVYVLRLTATAAGPLTVTDLVTVTVYENYDSWAASALASQSAANRLPGADPDGDGVSNLAEWVLGGNALNSSVTGNPVPSVVNGLLRITWQRNLQADPNVQVIPQLSTNLSIWEAGPTVLLSTITGSTPTTETWTAVETGTPDSRQRAFVRLQVVMP